jgi:hypothetical protein
MIAAELPAVNPQKTIVRYNRTIRQWQVINGTVRNFGSGKDAHRDALMAALEHDRPDLFIVVNAIARANDNNPQLIDRLLKAASLICQGHVYDNGRVKSQNADEPGKVYTVSYHPLEENPYFCDCADFENGLKRLAGLEKWGGIDTGQGLHCKHSLSVELAYIARLQLPSEPIPFQPVAPAPAFDLEEIDF